MEGVEIPKPSGKIVPLMDLRLAPVVKPGEEKEDSSEDEDKKKHFRPKKQIRNVFTRMQGNEYLLSYFANSCTLMHLKCL